MSATADLRETADCIINICTEKKLLAGEDCIIYSLGADSGLAGVLDGCGGAGAKKYQAFDNKSGAYMASRAAGAAFLDWFSKCASDDVASLKQMVKNSLSEYKAISGEQSRIMSSLSKEFPTTAAVFRVSQQKKNIVLDWYWAGDSRVYMLCPSGLKQLTVDDLNGIDPMENLYEDGVMSNVISLSADFTIHHGSASADLPCVVFAATDGCFGYLHTPMHFEYLLLETLDRSDSYDSWESSIYSVLKDTAGDDFTLCGLSLGFGGFDEFKKQMKKRKQTVYEKYIRPADTQGKDGQFVLWNEYKKEYLKEIR